MGDLIKLALLIAEGVSGRRGGQTTAEVARLAATTVAAACCGVAALTCGLVALWLYMLPLVGPTGAPLVVGGVLLVLCLVLLAVVRYGVRPRPPPPAAITPTALLAEATRVLNENKGTLLTAALLAGLVAGRRDK